MSKVKGPRRRKVATPAPRVQRKRKGERVILSRFEIRARAQTALLRNPDLSVRELSETIGQPYVVVRDLIDGDFLGQGLSQSRFPLHDGQPEPATAAMFEQP